MAYLIYLFLIVGLVAQTDPHMDSTKDKLEIPKPNPDLLQPNTDLPKPNTEVPKSNTEIPNPSPEIPKPNTEVPKPNPQIPHPNPQIPKPSTEIPQTNPQIPHLNPQIPKPSTQHPKPSTELPKVNIKIPKPLKQTATSEDGNIDLINQIISSHLNSTVSLQDIHLGLDDVTATLNDIEEYSPENFKHINQEQKELFQKQIDLQEAKNQQFKRETPEWIAKQFEEEENRTEINIMESFVFHLGQGEYNIFKIPLINGKRRIVASVYIKPQGDGQFSIATTSPQQQFVYVHVAHQFDALNGYDRDKIIRLSHVYVVKEYELHSQDDHIYISFINGRGDPIFIWVQLEGKPAVKIMTTDMMNKDLAEPSMKIATILNEMQSVMAHEKTAYKWAWGFLEKDSNHQKDLLHFAGFEILFLLATTIVQIYFIKNLFDYRTVI